MRRNHWFSYLKMKQAGFLLENDSVTNYRFDFQRYLLFDDLPESEDEGSLKAAMTYSETGEIGADNCILALNMPIFLPLSRWGEPTLGEGNRGAITIRPYYPPHSPSEFAILGEEQTSLKPRAYWASAPGSPISPVTWRY
jgi:hypothetical protein